MVSFCNHFNIVETETVSFYIVNITGWHSEKLFENFAVKLFRYANTVVGNADKQTYIITACGYGYFGSFIIVLMRIFSEPIYNILHVPFVCLNSINFVSTVHYDFPAVIR